MTIRKKKPHKGKVIIDLTGPQGNVFCLMGIAQRWAADLGLDGKKIIEEMKASDYENAVQVFDSYFGDYCILER